MRPADLLRSRFGGLGAPFWALQGGLFLNRAGAFVQPLLMWWLTGRHGLTLTQAGAVVSVYGLGSAIGTTAGGVVADRFGRKKALLLSALGAAVALLGLAQTTTVAAVVVGAFCLAVFYDLHRPAVHAMVADLVPAADRLRAYALTYVTVNLGFAVAPALAGWISGKSDVAIFYAAALVQVGWAVFVRLRLPETRPAPVAGAPPSGGLRAVLRDRVFIAWLAALWLATLLPHQAFVALAGWMKQEGHAASTYGAVLGLNGLLIVLVQPWVAPLIGRRDPIRVQCLAFLLQGIGFAMHGLGLGVPGHVAAVVVWTAGEIIAAPVTSAVVARLAPVDLRARYQGMTGTAFALAGMVGPLVGAAALDHWGGLIWAACLLMGLLAAAVMMAVGPHLRRRLEEPPHPRPEPHLPGEPPHATSSPEPSPV